MLWFGGPTIEEDRCGDAGAKLDMAKVRTRISQRGRLKIAPKRAYVEDITKPRGKHILMLSNEQVDFVQLQNGDGRPKHGHGEGQHCMAENGLSPVGSVSTLWKRCSERCDPVQIEFECVMCGEWNYKRGTIKFMKRHSHTQRRGWKLTRDHAGTRTARIRDAVRNHPAKTPR